MNTKEDEDAEILMLVQSDIDSSSDDDRIPPSNKRATYDSISSDASVLYTAANLVNFIEGIGFLAIPYALKEGGITALVAFIINPVIMWYMGTILSECLYDDDSQGRKIRARSSYKDLGEALLPKYGGYIVSSVVQLEVFLVGVSYLVLCASVMGHALPYVPITELMWIGIAGALVVPTTFLKSLSQIAWLSVISVFALIAVVVSVVWYGADHTIEWDLSTILFWDSEGVVMSLSIIIYSYGAYLIIPSLEGSMADKTKFSRALMLAYLVSMVLKLAFSVFGFLSFGVNTNEVILNNIPLGIVHITVSSFFAFSCIMSYPLAIYPVIESAHNLVTTRIQNDKIPSFLTYTLVRVTVVLGTVVVAILVPNFLVIISLMGSTGHCLGCYIFPCVLHIKMKYKQLKVHQICIESFLVFFGVILTIFGTAVSIKTLIKFYEQ